MNYLKELDETDIDKLLNFRKKIILENGATEDLISADFSHKKIVYELELNEDVFKFSNRKFLTTQFDKLIGYFIAEEIVSICGFHTYFETYLRIGMHYYTLKPYRTEAMSLLWREGGFLDYVYLQYRHYDGMFMSVYAHNDKLKSICRSMMSKKRHQLSKRVNSPYISRFYCIPNKYVFNNVEQYLIYHPLQKDCPEELLRNIKSMNS